MLDISRRSFMKTSVVLGAGLSLGVTGCGGDSDSQTSTKFAVLSDPHVYDTSLGDYGTAFDTYLSSDRKMLVESVEILESMVASFLATDNLEFVIIPGDLTKDGEKVCHEKAASILQPLPDNGISVYVVPGNHDINNPHAVSFSGATTTPVDSVTLDEFADIYADFGYGSAIYRDSNSLSYVAKVADKTWLFAIDSCKYNDNVTSPDTSGAISDETMDWILSKLAIAKNAGVTVFGMMHHAAIPHFAAQTTFFAEYIVDDHAVVGEAFADAGLNMLFTGHFHAQDIVKADYTSSTLYEVETGSGVTSPSPYRIIDLNIKNKTFNIESFAVHSIPSNSTFDTYKENFVNTGMLELYTTMLPQMGISVAIAPAAAEIHVAHYKGDEQGYASLSATSAAIIGSLLTSTDPTTLQLGYALADFAADNSLPDNDTAISI